MPKVSAKREKIDVAKTEARIEALEALVTEMAADLEAYVDVQWRYRDDYPHQMRKYNRDMEPVVKARALLSVIEPAKGDRKNG